MDFKKEINFNNNVILGLGIALILLCIGTIFIAIKVDNVNKKYRATQIEFAELQGRYKLELIKHQETLTESNQALIKCREAYKRVCREVSRADKVRTKYYEHLKDCNK